MKPQRSFRSVKLLRQWRKQFIHVPRRKQPIRPFAALTFLLRKPLVNRLVEIQDLLTLVVYDQSLAGRTEVIAAGFKVRQVPHGVVWGGLENGQFEKHLSLDPRPSAQGFRYDLSQIDSLSAALSLDQLLERHRRHSYAPRRSAPRLPSLWLAFPQSCELQLYGSGPEFEMAVGSAHADKGAVFANGLRNHKELVLCPLEWCSHLWRQSVAVFADFTGLTLRQVFALSEERAELLGFQGASQFDFRVASTVREYAAA